MRTCWSCLNVTNVFVFFPSRQSKLLALIHFSRLMLDLAWFMIFGLVKALYTTHPSPGCLTVCSLIMMKINQRRTKWMKYPGLAVQFCCSSLSSSGEGRKSERLCNIKCNHAFFFCFFFSKSPNALIGVFFGTRLLLLSIFPEIKKNVKPPNKILEIISFSIISFFMPQCQSSFT